MKFHILVQYNKFTETVLDSVLVWVNLYTFTSIITIFIVLCNEYFFLYFFFLRTHPKYMEFPSLGLESELQLPAYTTATATRDLNHICNLHDSSRQCQIFNPLSVARN